MKPAYLYEIVNQLYGDYPPDTPVVVSDYNEPIFEIRVIDITGMSKAKRYDVYRDYLEDQDAVIKIIA